MFSHQYPEEAETFSLSAHGRDWPLSDNFTLGEFACKDGSDFVLVHPSLVALLQNVRDHFGRAIHINSAYRTPNHNRNVGGSPKSKHMLGMAADIKIRGVSPDAVARYLEECDPGGVGRYDTFTHVDVYGALRRWDYRT